MESFSTKPKLAVLSSFNEDCANASFATTLCESLSEQFHVETFDLKSQSLMYRTGQPSVEAAERHIDAICERLQEFDLVNVHCELGLYGHTLEQMHRRLIKVCNSSKRLIFTMHRLDLQGDKFSFGDDFAHVYASLLNNLKLRSNQNSYHVLVHLPREKELIQEVFSIKNVIDYPVLHLSKDKRKFYQENINRKAWKESIGFTETDIIIGRFGFLATYKDHLLGLKLLKILPEKYKLAFVGGQHPATLKPFAVDPVVKDIIDFLDCNLDLHHRVAFLGHTDDSTFYTAMSNVDFVLVPHFEVGQSASAVTSMALELNRPTVVTYAFNFLEYNRYFPQSFEMFDVGNYYEARDKIIRFDFSKLENLKKTSQEYTLEKLTSNYMDMYSTMQAAAIDPVMTNEANIAESFANLMTRSRKNSSLLERLLLKIYQHLPEPVKRPIRHVKRAIFN